MAYDPNRPWRGWYGLKRWKDRRAEQLHREPLCAFCEAAGVTTAATVADHQIPHRGDPDLFWFGELQSLCVTHRNAAKQQIETRGYSGACDASGWPIDPNHPVNR